MVNINFIFIHDKIFVSFVLGELNHHILISLCFGETADTMKKNVICLRNRPTNEILSQIKITKRQHFSIYRLIYLEYVFRAKHCHCHVSFVRVLQFLSYWSSVKENLFSKNFGIQLWQLSSAKNPSLMHPLYVKLNKQLFLIFEIL